MATGLRTLGDHHVDSGGLVAGRVLGAAAHGPNSNVFRPQFLDYVRWRRAECADYQPHLRMAQHHVHQPARAIRSHRAAAGDDLLIDALALVVRQFRHAFIR